MKQDRLVSTTIRLPKKDLLAFRKKFKDQKGKRSQIIRDAVKKAIGK